MDLSETLYIMNRKHHEKRKSWDYPQCFEN